MSADLMSQEKKDRKGRQKRKIEKIENKDKEKRYGKRKRLEIERK